MNENALNLTKIKSFAASNQKRTTFFLDIDETLAMDGKLLPDAKKGLDAINKAGIEVVFVTGRHRDGLRKNEFGKTVKDGAVHDIFKGYDSWLSNCKMISGHGMEFFDGEKNKILGRSKKEQEFADFAGKQVEAFKKDLFEKMPEIEPDIDVGVKKHTIYANFSRLKNKDEIKAKFVGLKIKTAFNNICNMKTFNGNKGNNPENPKKAFQTCEEVDSFELRSKNWSKQKGIEASGLVEEALKDGGQIVIGCNSLKPTGTDRGMVIACRNAANKIGSPEKVKVIHVLNNREKNRVPKGDECEPDFTLSDVETFGKALGVYASEMTKQKQKANPVSLILKDKLKRRV